MPDPVFMQPVLHSAEWRSMDKLSWPGRESKYEGGHLLVPKKEVLREEQNVRRTACRASLTAKPGTAPSSQNK